MEEQLSDLLTVLGQEEQKVGAEIWTLCCTSERSASDFMDHYRLVSHKPTYRGVYAVYFAQVDIFVFVVKLFGVFVTVWYSLVKKFLV